MNVSLSSLERLLHRYTMEPTVKPFDVRSVPIEIVAIEPSKRGIDSRVIDSHQPSLFLLSEFHCRRRSFTWINELSNETGEHVEW